LTAGGHPKVAGAPFVAAFAMRGLRSAEAGVERRNDRITFLKRATPLQRKRLNTKKLVNPHHLQKPHETRANPAPIPPKNLAQSPTPAPYNSDRTFFRATHRS
jgi:hypothetical protein